MPVIWKCWCHTWMWKGCGWFTHQELSASHHERPHKPFLMPQHNASHAFDNNAAISFLLSYKDLADGIHTPLKYVFRYIGNFLTWSLGPSSPLYNTTAPLYKDQHQGHKYVSADRSIDHLVNDNKQGLQTGLSFGGLWKGAPVEKRQWWVNVNWHSSFSNQEASVWTWTRAKHSCHLLFFPLLLTWHDHGQSLFQQRFQIQKIQKWQGWFCIMVEGHWQSTGRSIYKPTWHLTSCSISAFGPFFWKALTHPQTQDKTLLVSELVREQSTHFLK